MPYKVRIQLVETGKRLKDERVVLEREAKGGANWGKVQTLFDAVARSLGLCPATPDPEPQGF